MSGSLYDIAVTILGELPSEFSFLYYIFVFLESLLILLLLGLL